LEKAKLEKIKKDLEKAEKVIERAKWAINALENNHIKEEFIPQEEQLLRLTEAQVGPMASQLFKDFFPDLFPNF
jgi:hypothetical protein